MNLQFQPLVTWFSTFGGVIFLAYLVFVYLKGRSLRPVLSPEAILFQERFASGHSLKNLLTRFGGASNCLRLVVTQDLVWVTSWFPFSLLAAFYDLEHVIPRNNIESVETTSVLWRVG